MEPFVWILLGLFSEICGAFLLSIEAIKMRNLKYLCEVLLHSIRHGLRSPTSRFVYEMVEKGELADDDIVFNNWASRHPRLFDALHFVAGAAVLLSINLTLQGAPLKLVITAAAWMFHLPWYYCLPLTPFVLWITIALFWGTGEAVHQGALAFLQWVVGFSEFAENRLESGQLGIAGFILLAIGFTLQAVGTILGQN